MASEIAIVITVVGSIITGGLGYVFTKWREREAEWRSEKREHYKELAMCISNIVEEVNTRENQIKYAQIFNRLNLVAPQSVIEALQAYHKESGINNPQKTLERHDKVLSKLFLEMRKDLQISPKDDCSTFRIHLVAPGPGKNEH
jgi:hypothetical protein